MAIFVDSCGKLPPVSMTPALPVAKFTAGVVETGGKFATVVADISLAP